MQKQADNFLDLNIMEKTISEMEDHQEVCKIITEAGAGSIGISYAADKIMDVFKYKDETINREILALNKDLIGHNKRILLQNMQMAKEEHHKKMDLFELQRQAILSTLPKPDPSDIKSGAGE